MARTILTHIPLAYRALFLWFEPLAAFVGSFIIWFNPVKFLNTMDATAKFAPDNRVIYNQLAATYTLFAYNEAILLRTTKDLRIWRTVLFGILICDALHLYASWLAVPSVFWNPAVWRWEDWVNFGNFDRNVETLMQKNRVPGLSIAIIQGDQIKSAGFGFASIEAQEPCTPDTLFDIASSSKSLTAAAIALLVQDDNFPEIQYDSVMSKLLPDDFVMSNELHTKTVTVDDLLGHHTGLPGHDDSYMGVRAARPDDARSITRNLRNLAVAAPPRTRYIYCNMMYTVLTHLIEVKTRQKFDKFLQKRIFDPLGMTSSSLQPDGAKAKGHAQRLARGHIWDKKLSSYREFEPVNCPEGQGAGSVISSANDFVKFLRALTNLEDPITEAVYQGLTRPRSERGANNRQRKAGIDRLYYTAGMDLYWQGGHAILGHSGDITGFGSRFLFLPEFKFGAVVMGNSSGTNSVAAQLFREMIDTFLPFQKEGKSSQAKLAKTEYGKLAERREEPKKESQTQPRKVNKSGSQAKGHGMEKASVTDQIGKVKQENVTLGAYTGNYWNPGYHNLTVELKDNELVIDATDRSLGFTARLKHKQDHTIFDAHVRDVFETGDEVLKVEFVVENGEVVRMGMDLEPLVNALIWFQKVKEQ
ncbi:hypothetical protein FBEOM_1807 [Fusarium beomiforme]|uniref:Beta-lactamase-related domain-containing protein n=1 Tax=Fusarium beomiforme TaxID=44412 RepID=A0A9P5AT38_9HYPO|nr:hypothetical protein FBEOM_1807 [Fusarium beomiforme]